ncbi:RNA polymerase sigma factor [Parvicella tangerina]|uniref:RNA polymerase sigma-H factor n=1 Tax=Parvicella tangerina TaxID=2829795 RepID=A0A916JJX6_9FLAO|nr:RNA polymerase sigma factor [Parvicella tangerina]CAG5078094.1 RNA polymerase sigma-H factor [Parvicella tangerina]
MKPTQEELDLWIKGCKQNDKKCQKKVYEMLFSPMLGVCMRYAQDRQDATDILQDGFIKVFEKIGLYDDNGSFEGWVRRIIVNTAIDAIRKRKNELLTDDTSVYQPKSGYYESQGTEEAAYKGLKVGDVVDAMQELSPMYRTVFNLYVMDGLTHQEIADELDISVGTSKSNLSKARARIKTILEKKISGQ